MVVVISLPGPGFLKPDAGVWWDRLNLLGTIYYLVTNSSPRSNLFFGFAEFRPADLRWFWSHVYGKVSHFKGAIPSLMSLLYHSTIVAAVAPFCVFSPFRSFNLADPFFHSPPYSSLFLLIPADIMAAIAASSLAILPLIFPNYFVALFWKLDKSAVKRYLWCFCDSCAFVRLLKPLQCPEQFIRIAVLVWRRCILMHRSLRLAFLFVKISFF